MQVTCSVCGKQHEITKMHKDYRKLAGDPSAIYICPACNMQLRGQAVQEKRNWGPG